MSAPRSEGKANPHRAISHNHSSTIFPLADIEQWIHPQDPDFIKEAKRTLDVEDYTYTERDVILYNIGVGASAKDLKYVYEGHENFGAVPTFGVIPSFITSFGMRLDFLPGYSHLKLLHGEQYLKICAPIPTSGTLTTESRIVEVLDKGKAASVTMYTTTKDQEGTLVFENYSLLFVRGSGGFGGQKTGSDRGPVTALNKLPDRPADVVVEQKTSTDQAAIYRLSGDYNPLHIDPAASKVGGFDKPIIHGLCFFGIAGRHVVDTYGPIKEIKVRFAGSLFPGETVCTHLWRDGDKVTFVSKCKERDVIILSAAAATLA